MNKKALTFTLTSIVLAVFIGLSLGQGFTGGGYSPLFQLDKQPPIGLDKAYNLALAKMGAQTNQFYCLIATCIKSSSKQLTKDQWSQGWLFGFANTNGVRVNIEVYFSGGAVVYDPHTSVIEF
jgi:hypothetical protein